MLLIHKETAEIFELRIKSLNTEEIFNGSFGIGEIVLLCDKNSSPICSLWEMPEHFEILGGYSEHNRSHKIR